MKITKQQLKQIINEEVSKIVNENQPRKSRADIEARDKRGYDKAAAGMPSLDSARSLSYSVVEDEFDGGPRVDIKFDNGAKFSFEDMIGDLEGQTLDFGDEPPFKFSIDLFDGEPWKMIVNGVAPAYIEMWAEMHNIEASGRSV